MAGFLSWLEERTRSRDDRAVYGALRKAAAKVSAEPEAAGELRPRLVAALQANEPGEEARFEAVAELDRLFEAWDAEQRGGPEGDDRQGGVRAAAAHRRLLGWFVLALLALFLFSALAVLQTSPGTLGTEDQLRGLISYMLAGGTLIVALVLISGAFALERGEFEERFRQGKDVLAALIGILGTVVGFYFGVGEHTRPPAEPPRPEAPRPPNVPGQAGVAGPGCDQRGPAAIAVLCMTTSGPQATASPPASPPLPSAAPTVLAAWVQIIPVDAACDASHCPPQALLRIVAPRAETCVPGLARDAGRAGAPMELMPRRNPAPERFPVTVCEAVLPINHPGAVLPDGTRLSWRHLAAAAPRSIAVIGDTGCDDTTSPTAQNCRRPEAWPLAQVAAQAATIGDGQPDLVLHVGDYRYRGTDSWENWLADVFAPMRPLLVAAPWVAVRGNHENCYESRDGARAGEGWALLLAPTPGVVPACPWGSATPQTIEASYPVDFGSLRLVVMDSADAKYRCDTWVTSFRERHQQQLAKLLDLSRAQEPDSAAARDVWLLTHYAVFDGSIPDDNGCGPVPHPRNPQVTLTPPAYRSLMADIVFAARVSTVLSGDIHHLQITEATRRDGARVQQFVAGHGGVLLDVPEGWPQRGDHKNRPSLAYCNAKFGSPQTDLNTRVQLGYGFLEARAGDRGWELRPRITVPAGTPAGTEPWVTTPPREPQPPGPFRPAQGEPAPCDRLLLNKPPETPPPAATPAAASPSG